MALGDMSDGPVANRDTSVALAVGGSAFTTLAINAAKTTDGIKVKGFRSVALNLDYVYAAGTAVTMTVQTSEDNTTWRDMHTLQFTSFPTAASLPQVWSYSAGASKSWQWNVAINTVYVRFIFTATGGNSSDTLSAGARLCL